MTTNFNYKNICQKLLQGLPQRTKEVISARFGLDGKERETLEAIGKNYGITRERVRQIEEDGLLKMKLKMAGFQEIIDHFTNQLKATGGIRREDNLLNSFGDGKFKNPVFLLLTLAGSFIRSTESKDFYSFWALDQESVQLAQKVVNYFKDELNKAKQPVTVENYKIPFTNVSSPAVVSYLEASRTIQRGVDGLFGLKDWPEINPRGVKDKAYLALKKANTPLHFSEVAKRIGKDALPQTVHNELIKDSRFVLVGRGLYALRSWGYEPGMVKDVIARVLKGSKQPLTKEEVINAVLKQRFVKENTIALNLSDKRYFLRTPEGRYTIREI